MFASTITNASATSGWIKSDILPYVRHTVSNPGSIKICGDHKCSPFENMKKPIEYMQKQNQITGHPMNNINLIKISDKTASQEAKTGPIMKNGQRF